MTGRSASVTGDEPGSCKAVTGTPYAGAEQYDAFCATDEAAVSAARTRPLRSTPGSVMTYFPFTGAKRGRHGTGEVGITGFAVPKATLPYWKERLTGLGVTGLTEAAQFGEALNIGCGVIDCFPF